MNAITIWKHSLKIARAFRRVQFERIFKYHEQCKSIIARAFIRLLTYYMTEKIANARALITTTVQIKNERYIGLLSANHDEVISSVI